LLATMNTTDDTPLEGVRLIANPDDPSMPFTTNVLPAQAGTLGAMLDESVQSTLLIGLGESLTGGKTDFFIKQFTVIPQQELSNQNITVTVPPSPAATHPLGASTSITIGITVPASTPYGLQVHVSGLFVRDATASTINWTRIQTQTTSDRRLLGSYHPPRGCGVHYVFAA